MAYEKVEAKFNVWDYKTVPSIEGEYIEVKTGIGANNSNIYSLKQDNGDIIDFWGSSVLDPKMKEAFIGNRVKVEYLGTTKNKTKGRKDIKLFEVWIDKEWEAPAIAE